MPKGQADSRTRGQGAFAMKYAATDREFKSASNSESNNARRSLPTRAAEHAGGLSTDPQVVRKGIQHCIQTLLTTAWPGSLCLYRSRKKFLQKFARNTSRAIGLSAGLADDSKRCSAGFLTPRTPLRTHAQNSGTPLTFTAVESRPSTSPSTMSPTLNGRTCAQA